MLRDKNLSVDSNLVETLTNKTAEKVSGGAWMRWAGKGAWRQLDGKHGKYRGYWNIPLKACKQICLVDGKCTGIEYNKSDTGPEFCEIHSDQLGYIEAVDIPGLDVGVYVKEF